MTLRWRGRPDCFEQVGNAKDSFVDLTPVSEAPAEQTRSNWSALLPGQDIPLIGEDSRYGYREREEDCP
jgi:hypothetical protein